jgi:hypothetical protein
VNGEVVKVVILVVIAAGVVSFDFWRWRARLARLGRVMERGTLRLHGLIGEYRATGTYRGRPAGMCFTPRTRASAEYFEVTLGTGTTLSCTIGREGPGPRIADALHLRRDVETGDPGLDARFAFDAAQPERFAGWFRSSEQARRAVEALFGHERAARVWVRPPEVGFRRDRFDSVPAGPDEARRLLERLFELAEAAERA